MFYSKMTSAGATLGVALQGDINMMLSKEIVSRDIILMHLDTIITNIVAHILRVVDELLRTAPAFFIIFQRCGSSKGNDPPIGDRNIDNHSQFCLVICNACLKNDILILYVKAA